jgi:hypothetical protein
MEVNVTFTIRNIGGVALLVFGSTFLWFTPDFATRGISTSSTWWSITRALALVTVVAFTAATWGLFQRAAWWEPAALAATFLGVLALICYWVAAQLAGDPGRWMNAFVHILGTAGVLALLLVPRFHQWVDSHVMSS